MDTDPIDRNDSSGAALMARRFRTRYASRQFELATHGHGEPAPDSGDDGNSLDTESVGSALDNACAAADTARALVVAEPPACGAVDPVQTQRQLMNQFLEAYAAARGSSMD